MPCEKRGLPCEYPPSINSRSFASLKRENTILKERINELAKTIEALKNLPKENAIKNKNLSLTGEASTTLPQPTNTPVSISTLLAQILPTPPAQDGAEFELMIRHPIAYPALAALDIPVVDRASSHPPCSAPRQHGDLHV